MKTELRMSEELLAQQKERMFLRFWTIFLNRISLAGKS